MIRRTQLQRRTPLRATQPLTATRGRSTDSRETPKTAQRRSWTPSRRDTGPTKKVRDTVKARDGWCCVRCGVDVHGIEHNIQHRRARGQGGTVRPDTNLPANLILLCGTPLTRCHGRVESHHHEAQGYGWAIPLAAATPSDWPVWVHGRGLVLLDDDGGWRPA